MHPVLAVALAQRGDELRVPLAPTSEEPLLELVEDQQQFLPGAQDPPSPQHGQRVDQTPLGTQLRARFAEAPEQAGLGLFRGGLDVHRQDVLAQPGE
jgi:hypothetical protein